MTTQPQAAIEMTDLTKCFRGKPAVDALTLQIFKNDIFGFIGPNGAGKTTTMRMLATLLPPDRGNFAIMGFDSKAQPREIRHRIGYMPDFFGVYRDMDVEEYLYFFATAYSLPQEKIGSIVDGVLQVTELTEKRNAIIGTLSRGMQQRLGLARVLVHDPDVLLLDEPASGLDPRARIEIRALLKELGRLGKTIFISSHILSDLADICNRVGIIEQGRLLFAGTMEEAYRRVKGVPVVIIGVERDPDKALEFCAALPGVGECHIEDGQLRIALSGEDTRVPQLVSALVGAGFAVQRVVPQEVALEDAFLHLTQGKLA